MHVHLKMGANFPVPTFHRVGHPMCTKQEEADFCVERLELLMNSINDEKTRYRLFEQQLVTCTGWRKPVSMGEAVDLKVVQEDLVAGVTVRRMECWDGGNRKQLIPRTKNTLLLPAARSQVFKYSYGGDMSKCHLMLDLAQLKDLALGEESRRPRIVLSKDGSPPGADSKVGLHSSSGFVFWGGRG